MFLEVPIKLEGYINAIKEQTKFIQQESNRITLLQVGKSQQEEHTKLMYILYNPYPVTLTIDLNFFDDVNNLYKMYPTQFQVAPETSFAFVVFVNKYRPLAINERRLISILKRNIDGRIMRMNNTSYQGKYQNSLIYNIDEPRLEIDKTMLLNKKHTNKPEDEIVEFNSTYNEFIKIDLLKLTDDSENYIFKFKFLNESNFNFKVKRLKFKLFDDIKKFYVNINEEVVFKNHSSKEITIYINKAELKDVDVRDLQVKISLV